MSNEEIKTLIQQEAEQYIASGVRGNWAASPVFNEVFRFYEQSILPEILKEKDEKIREQDLIIYGIEEGADEWRLKCSDLEYSLAGLTILREKDACSHNEEMEHLRKQLSQLQSKMEEENRKAFEAAKKGKAIPLTYSGGSIWESDFPTYDDYLKSSTQSTESGNLNKQ